MNTFYKTLRLATTIAQTDIKVKYENIFFGFVWYVIDPLIIFAIFMLLKNSIAPDIPYYPLYLIIGIVLFNFFRKATAQSITTLQAKQIYIRSMSVNADALILSNIITALQAHVIEILLIAIIMLFVSAPILQILFSILLVCAYTLFILGTSFFVATVGMYVRDFSNIWNIFTRLLWFATPIFYITPSTVATTAINILNPLYHFIEVSRYFLIPDYTLAHSSTPLLLIFYTTLSFSIGYYIFHKHKSYFPEIA